MKKSLSTMAACALASFIAFSPFESLAKETPKLTKINAPTKKKGKNLGHTILDLERPMGARSRHHKILDRILKGAERVIVIGNTNTFEGATNILGQISNYLKSIEGKKMEYKKGESLYVTLESGFFDCDRSSILYLSIADHLNLPLRAVHIPGHVYVRWMYDEKRYLSWETTRGFLTTSEFYEQSPFSMPKGRIGRTLSHDDVLINYPQWLLNHAQDGNVPGFPVQLYTDRERSQLEKKMLQILFSHYQGRIETEPKNASLYGLQGDVLGKLGSSQRALQHYEVAIKLSPESRELQDKKKKAEYAVMRK